MSALPSMNQGVDWRSADEGIQVVKYLESQSCQFEVDSLRCWKPV